MSFPTINTKSALLQLAPNALIVSLSDAEAEVIKNKARKAGLSVNEYIRNAALGFPMG
ncbi:ribbon-helix-helix protein, CopG family [Pleurocapsales cyanobacterium LEGE 10410]|nr:ribbon-helix-helix protein, CopG family [Pleurocapsales cyanobacterium LEGE 10410]